MVYEQLIYWLTVLFLTKVFIYFYSPNATSSAAIMSTIIGSSWHSFIFSRRSQCTFLIILDLPLSICPFTHPHHHLSWIQRYFCNIARISLILHWQVLHNLRHIYICHDISLWVVFFFIHSSIYYYFRQPTVPLYIYDQPVGPPPRISLRLSVWFNCTSFFIQFLDSARKYGNNIAFAR